jgi:glycine cleavage system H protein
MSHMPDDLTFMMGKHAARLPGDVHYARNHMWARKVEGRWAFGFSAYAVRLMQDVYFLDWSVDDGAELALKQQIGHIETSKAVSDLYAPIAGTMTSINRDLLKDPSAINVDGYGRGRLFEMTGDAADLMDAAGYVAFLEVEWAKAQRVIKSQILKG